MAKGKAPKTAYKKGVSGNPNGRPRMPQDLRNVKKLKEDEFKAIVSLYAHMTKNELLDVIQDPATPVLHLSVCSILSKVVKEGDHARLDFLLNRTIGKVKETKEIYTPEPTIIIRGNGEQIELGAKYTAIEGEILDDE